MNIAINGFGRIGRNFLRALLADKKALQKIKVVAINIGPQNIDNVAHMFKYDTLMGTYSGSVVIQNNKLVIDDYKIDLISEVDPKKIHWKQYNIEWVVESSGFFTTKEKAQLHLDSGAQSVLISAPAKQEDITIIPGVNHKLFDKGKHKIVSLGSCTTNAFLPLLTIINNRFGIKSGFMTTIHSYTNTQVLIDTDHKDLRRSRAAALNIIPTTTGAAKMVEKVIPELTGKIGATSVRVPVAKVSLIDAALVLQNDVTKKQIEEALQLAAKNEMKNIVQLCYDELVSSDFSCNDHSVIVDMPFLDVRGSTVKIFGWYDNEWGYSVRLKDFLISI